ncbi:MAG: hypothetical protein ABIE84_06535 [bacterium]
MIKKKAKPKKANRTVKAKKAKKGQKAKKVVKVKGPKIIGKIDHFFGKINVAALRLKSPLKVGDYIHIKGATTDFVQRVDSMQINHHDVEKAPKGKDVGFRVRSRVRMGDSIYVASQDEIRMSRPQQLPTFPVMTSYRPEKLAVRLQARPQPMAKPTPPPPQKKSGYSEIKFLGF